MSHPGPHVDIVGFDKVEHCTYFCAGGLALGQAFWLAGKYRPVVIGTLVVLVGAAVGWFDEWHQTFTPGRSGLDVYDWIADGTGSVLAAFLLQPARRWLAG
jgi:VanZ family protein